MIKLMMIIGVLYWLCSSPKSFLVTAAILFCIGFILRHPILCIVGFLILCFSIGWYDDVTKNDKKENEYKRYNQTNNNQNQYKQQSSYTQYKRYNYFQGCTTKEQLKKKHRELCMKLHPDKGGDINQFRQMQEEYEMLRKKFN